MCGVAGYVGPNLVAPVRVQEALALMRRRGPDHQDSIHIARPRGGHVHLLHARLNIVDLDRRSNQPFSRDGITAVYNGEIYNYLEVRDDLAALGHVFATTSDTEVLCAALRQWGADALDRLEGMWAFAAYDARDASLLLSRDRFGEKPLYMLEEDGGLYFASEVKALAALVGRKLAPNQAQLARYLVHGYKSLYKQGETFFRDVRELPAATIARVPAEGTRVAARYWQARFEPDESMTAERAAAETRDAFVRAVQIRLRADVPLAFCMSGGIDSNAIISVAKRVLGYDVHGFTIMNSDARYEEKDLVDLAVAELGVRHTSIQSRDAGSLDALRELVRQHDAPVYTISYLLHWALMRAVHDAGYRVSVSGTGADELFTGYYDHHLQYLYEVRDQPEVRDPYRAAWMAHVKPIVRNPFLSDPELFVRDAAFRDHIYLDADVFRGFLRVPFDETFREEAYTGRSLLRNRLMNELFHEAVPVILHEDDLNAMYFSIENRSPFLDRRLYELCLRIPPRLLMRDGKGKIVLRDAMRGIVPDPVLDSRRKVGFNAPIRDVVDTRDPAVQRMLLEDGPVFDLVERERVKALFEKEALPNSQSKFLFYFVNAKLFLEEHGR